MNIIRDGAATNFRIISSIDQKKEERIKIIKNPKSIFLLVPTPNDALRKGLNYLPKKLTGNRPPSTTLIDLIYWGVFGEKGTAPEQEFSGRRRESDLQQSFAMLR